MLILCLRVDSLSFWVNDSKVHSLTLALHSLKLIMAEAIDVDAGSHRADPPRGIRRRPQLGGLLYSSHERFRRAAQAFFIRCFSFEHSSSIGLQ